MTREDILKELELWPLWKLKAMVPDMSAEAVAQREPKTLTEPEPAIAATETIAPVERGEVERVVEEARDN